MNQEIVLSELRKSLAKPCGIALVSIMIISLLTAGVCAAADLTVSPGQTEYEGYVGDTIILKGDFDTVALESDTGEDNELTATTSFTTTVPVNDGVFEYGLDDVKIPKGTDAFIVKSEKVSNMSVTVELPSYLAILSSFVPSISADADTTGIATISQSNVPSGTYDVIISGYSDQESVDITMIGKDTLGVDDSGSFSTSYDTESVPAGLFNVEVGDESYQITLLEEKKATVSTDSKKSSSSHTGTELKIIPADETDDAGADSNEGEGDSEPEEVLGSPAEDTSEPEENIPQETSTEPEPTFFQWLIGWFGNIFS